MIIEDGAGSNATLPEMTSLGSLKIDIGRVVYNKLGAPRVSTSETEKLVTEVSEKMLKGKAIESALRYAVGQLASGYLLRLMAVLLMSGLHWPLTKTLLLPYLVLQEKS